MNDDTYRRIDRAIRYLQDNFRSQPELRDVARAVGLSESHFQRLFSRWAGISPKRFLQFLTAEHARDLLERAGSVLDAAYGAGLSGPGRLHDLIVNVHAVTPGELKSRGEGLTIRYGTHPTPFGDCFLAVTDRGVCALNFLSGRGVAGEVGELEARWAGASVVADAAATRAVADRIFDPARRKSARPLTVLVKGTNFQVRVWEALLRIPVGGAASYEEIAARVGAPRAVRAVGSAVGKNPVSVLIPCHRVIRKTGAFGNYGGGPARKKAILAWEAARTGAAGSGPGRTAGRAHGAGEEGTAAGKKRRPPD